MSALPSSLAPPSTRLESMRLPTLAEVLIVEHAAYDFPWTRENFVSSLVSGYLAECLRDGTSGQLIGYYVAMHGVDEMHLLNLTVAPSLQGRGYGRALLEALRVRSLQSDARKLWLEVRMSNERARELYERAGFRSVGLRRGYYPARDGREDAIVMSLELQPDEAGN